MPFPLKNTRRATWFAAVLAIAGAGIAALWFIRVPTVDMVQPSRGPAVKAVYATGTVEAGITVRIAPRVAARLVELSADEGAHVKAGQRLARLDDRDLRSALAEAEARLQYAESQSVRMDNLAASGFATRDRVEQARAERDAARANAARAREQLGFMALVAPAAGVVIRRDGEVGDFIAVNQPVFYLASEGAAPRIDADVDEEDVVLLKPGQTVLIKADAFPDQVFKGAVTDITPKGDPLTRSYRVRIGMDADVPLRIGMTAEANIVISERRDALMVPAAAVHKDAVWLVKDGRLDLLPVKVGVRGAERIEILDGLAGDAWLVAAARDDFRAGQRVKTKQTPRGKP